MPARLVQTPSNDRICRALCGSLGGGAWRPPWVHPSPNNTGQFRARYMAPFCRVVCFGKPQEPGWAPSSSSEPARSCAKYIPSWGLKPQLGSGTLGLSPADQLLTEHNLTDTNYRHYLQ